MATIICPNVSCRKEVNHIYHICPYCGTSLDIFLIENASNYSKPEIPPAKKDKVKEDRTPWLYTIITILTINLSNLIIFTRMTKELNRILDNTDEITPYLAAHYISFFFPIYALLWFSWFTGTIGEEMRFRGIAYKYNRWTFWGWCVLGLFVVVGPIIYFYKTFKAFNMLAHEYNKKG